VIARVRIWPLDLAVARAIAKLDFASDPAVIIAASSLVHGIPLVTRDRRIRRSRLVPLAKWRK
jgi:predicted nucleic acid-binding protein